MPSEIEKFQNDLLESVRQMKRGEAVRTTQVKLPESAHARAKNGSSPWLWRTQRSCANCAHKHQKAEQKM